MKRLLISFLLFRYSLFSVTYGHSKLNNNRFILCSSVLSSSVKSTFVLSYFIGFGLFPNLRAVGNLVTTAHVLHRKEVIQPHLPIRLPCYDLTPIIEPTFDCCLLAVSSQASGVPNFHGLTGGVYKARERIHRGMLIRDY